MSRARMLFRLQGFSRKTDRAGKSIGEQLPDSAEMRELESALDRLLEEAHGARRLVETTNPDDERILIADDEDGLFVEAPESHCLILSNVIALLRGFQAHSMEALQSNDFEALILVPRCQQLIAAANWFDGQFQQVRTQLRQFRPQLLFTSLPKFGQELKQLRSDLLKLVRHLRPDSVTQMLLCYAAQDLRLQTNLPTMRVQIGRRVYRIDLQKSLNTQRHWKHAREYYDSRLADLMQVVDGLGCVKEYLCQFPPRMKPRELECLLSYISGSRNKLEVLRSIV